MFVCSPFGCHVCAAFCKASGSIWELYFHIVLHFPDGIWCWGHENKSFFLINHIPLWSVVTDVVVILLLLLSLYSKSPGTTFFHTLCPCRRTMCAVVGCYWLIYWSTDPKYTFWGTSVEYWYLYYIAEANIVVFTPLAPGWLTNVYILHLDVQIYIG